MQTQAPVTSKSFLTQIERHFSASVFLARAAAVRVQAQAEAMAAMPRLLFQSAFGLIIEQRFHGRD
jgi:hypothetical protein